MESKNKQFIWIVRYGLTEFPLVENKGPYDSDIDPKEGPNGGITHAEAIAKRITQSEDTSIPTRVYASPFLRTVHTADIICSGLAHATGTLRIEEGLTEWKQPSLLVEPDGTRTYPKSPAEHAKTFTSVDLSYESLNPVPSDDNWESEEVLIERCGTTLHEILKYEKGNNVAIVSHAPVDIALSLIMDGKNLDDSNLPALPLGGITRFCRNVNTDGTFGEWKMEFFGSTDHMPGDYKAGMKHWTLPSLQSKQ